MSTKFKWLTMKFQSGGQAQQIMQQIQSLVDAAIQGNTQAAQQVYNLVNDPQNSQLISTLQQSQPELYQAMKQISDSVAAGAVNAKKEGGKFEYLKALRHGGCASVKPAKKAAKKKAKCGCKLARIGGRLVNIDECTGKILN